MTSLFYAIVTVSIPFIVFNTVAVILLRQNLLKVRENDHISRLENKIARIKSDTQSLVDKYKNEQRQQHWKQYNHWKDKIERLEIKICNKCSSENLSTLVFYDNDYPVSAEFHCDDCYYCINKWEFKEDNQ